MKFLRIYLTDEAHRYFPKTEVEVIIDQETVVLRIDGDEWDCVIGSDDDWYSFSSRRTDNIITIPLQPEDNGWDDLTQAQQDYIVDMIKEQIRDCLEEEAFDQALALTREEIQDYITHMEEDDG